MTPDPQASKNPSFSSWLRGHLGLVVALATLVSSLVTVATWLGWSPFAG
ncbi:hypothetical protein ACWFMI_27220 [Nocardiopsis terrae]